MLEDPKTEQPVNWRLGILESWCKSTKWLS